MTTLLTDHCTTFYYLSLRLARRKQRFYSLLNNMPVYSGKNRISEMDDILSYYSDVLAIEAKVDKTQNEMKEVGSFILKVMTHFSIKPGTFLFGEIPGELEFLICIDEHDELMTMKTKDLTPETDSRTIIKIKVCTEDEDEDDDY